MTGITTTTFGQMDEAFGRQWVRTNMTMRYLSLCNELTEFAEFADDINATVLDGPGLQVCMQANGWAVVPEGIRPEYAAALIDTAVEMVVESYR